MRVVYDFLQWGELPISHAAKSRTVHVWVPRKGWVRQSNPVYRKEPFSEVVRISHRLPLTFSVPAQPRVSSSSYDANQRSQGDRLTPGNSRPTFSG
jgi:hypothetical protein